MAERLVVAVLGKRNSGKSSTWNALFGSEVRTGQKSRKLWLSAAEWIEVFLVSGSPEERETFIGEILPTLPENGATVVLCSMQYRADVTGTLDFFINNGFQTKVIWLNPGYGSPEYTDELQLVPYLIENGAWVVRRDANFNLGIRCQEIREILYGWGWARGLLHPRT